jgi:hypothetical protein
MINTQGNLVREALIRYAGTLLTAREHAGHALNNPVVWFREGVQAVLVIPVMTFHWVGIMTGETAAQISGSTLFKLFSALVMLASLLGSIVAIVLGWEAFVDLLGRNN